MKTKREPVKATNVIHCIACNEDFNMLLPDGHAELKRHMAEKHQVTEFKGSKQLAMHMDGDTWFSYSWNLDIGGVKFVQNTTQPRSREDQAYWDAAGD